MILVPTFIILVISCMAQDKNFKAFHVDSLLQKTITWNKFLDTETLFMGVYQLKAGETDLQTPHDEDEVYYVLKGKAKFQVDGNILPVTSGDILYVRAHTAHHFYDIEESLTLLVFFSKASSEKR